jgi:hypothetical protein
MKSSRLLRIPNVAVPGVDFSVDFNRVPTRTTASHPRLNQPLDLVRWAVFTEAMTAVRTARSDRSTGTVTGRGGRRRRP